MRRRKRKAGTGASRPAGTNGPGTFRDCSCAPRQRTQSNSPQVRSRKWRTSSRQASRRGTRALREGKLALHSAFNTACWLGERTKNRRKDQQPQHEQQSLRKKNNNKFTNAHPSNKLTVRVVDKVQQEEGRAREDCHHDPRRPSVSVSSYCCCEALRNVARHCEARGNHTRCWVICMQTGARGR